MKVSEYITDFLVTKHIHKVFSVTGGFAMHLNDSFGRRLDVTYTHGENPAGYAALGWSSVDREPSVCCVTSGCGATNAVTPCLIAYQDSVPVFFISGQVQKDVNIRSRGGHIRGYFGSDCDIVECVKGFTKFAHELRDPRDIHTVLETCWSHLTTGRLGPVWLSVPVDVQSMEVPELVVPPTPPPQPVGSVPTEFKLMWTRAQRPIVLAGNGVHISRTREAFRKFIDFHKVPYVVTYFGSDLGDDYIGKVGIIGDRAGNFAIQNADLVVCLGCRLSKTITGYNRDLFAREAVIVCVDTDESENIADKKIDMFVQCDLATFFSETIPLVYCMDPEYEVAEFAASELRKWPEVKTVLTRSQLRSGSATTDYWGELLRNGYDAQRSGEVIFLLQPGYLAKDHDEPKAHQGTSHGSAFNYDTHVPLLWYGKGIPQGLSLYEPIQITDISATLVHILNLQRPGSMIGKPILPLLQPKK